MMTEGEFPFCQLQNKTELQDILLCKCHKRLDLPVLQQNMEISLRMMYDAIHCYAVAMVQISHFLPVYSANQSSWTT